MANTTKNRQFLGDMGYNKTQSKTKVALCLCLQIQTSFFRNFKRSSDLFNRSNKIPRSTLFFNEIDISFLV